MVYATHTLYCSIVVHYIVYLGVAAIYVYSVVIAVQTHSYSTARLGHL